MHPTNVQTYCRGSFGKQTYIILLIIHQTSIMLLYLEKYQIQLISLLWQGNPPFEKPSIAKGVTNFVLFKFGHLPQKDWQTMYDLAKMFLHCLNHWKLETPTARKQTMSSDDISAYKVILIDTTWFKAEC